MPKRIKRRAVAWILGPLALLIVTASPAAAPPGDLDTTFDGDGRVTTSFAAFDRAYGVAIQADGKIVAAGDSQTVSPTGPISRSAVIFKMALSTPLSMATVE